MIHSRIIRPAILTLAAMVLFICARSVSSQTQQTRARQNQNLDPATLRYLLPTQIHWVADPMGAETAVLAGNPSKPGLYIVLVKWLPHHMSHPHWHPNVRYITVLSGTWWVGTGTRFDPNRTVPMRAGTFVTHYAKHVHYDGAKDDAALIEIVGEGPATATPAETK